MRKTITAVFTDLVGSTALGERLDPEVTRAVMERYYENMRVILEGHGGTVQKFIGDAVVGFFGIPIVHEDDALRAVKAAVEMRSALQKLNAELERFWGVKLSIRTGINTGEVVVDDSSLGGSLAIGDAINVAARLEQAAEPGEILLGLETYRLVRGAVRVEPQTTVDLKGKSRAVTAFCLMEVVEGAPAIPRRFDTPMIGRRRELGSLDRLLGEAIDNKGSRICTVLGGPGVGKSRLAHEWVRSVEDRASVLTGRCLSYGEGTTFQPLIEMLGFLPESLEVEEIFINVRDRFESLAAERSLVAVFDDLHWAEPTLLDLIGYLATVLQGLPLLCVCLARPDFQPPWEGERILLSPLPRAEAAELVRGLSGELSEEQEVLILQRAEGNPLYLEQMLAMLAEDSSFEVPPSIQVLISARLDRLPSDELRLAQRASVVGRGFSRSSLVALSPPGTEVSATLQRLMRKDLLESHRSNGADELHFKHALIRDGAYASLAKSERASLHARLAGWLAEKAGAEEVIGFHFEQAFRHRTEIGPADEKARALASEGARRLRIAGRRALDQGDLPAAVNLLGRSFALEVPENREYTLLSIAFASALVGTGDLERAAKTLERAVADANDPVLRFHARLELTVVRTTAGLLTDSEELRRIAEEAMQVFENAGYDLGLAAAWSAVGLFHHNAVRVEPRHEAYERALDYARRAQDSRLQRQLIMRLTQGLEWGPMPVSDALRYCKELLDECRGDVFVEAACYVALGVMTAMTGEFNEGRALVERAHRTWSEFGDTIGILRASESRRGVEMLAGNFVAAEEETRRALKRLENIGDRGGHASRAGFLGEALVAQGRFEEAEHYALLCREGAPQDDVEAQALWRQVLARVLAHKGDLERAGRLAAEAVARAELTDAFSWHASLLLNQAEVLSMAGHTHEAKLVARRALRLFERKGDLVGAARARNTFGA